MTDQSPEDNDLICDAADYGFGTLSIVETGLENIGAACQMIMDKHSSDSLAAGLAQLALLEVSDMLGFCQRGMAAVEEARSASRI